MPGRTMSDSTHENGWRQGSLNQLLPKDTSRLSKAERREFRRKLVQDLELVARFQSHVDLIAKQASTLRAPAGLPDLIIPKAKKRKGDALDSREDDAYSVRGGKGPVVVPGGIVKKARVGGMNHMVECRKILDQILRQKWAWPFRQPVDYVKLGIPDYPNVIKEPMDLGTVRGRLNSGKYDSPAGFARDVRLVWKNAMTYNAPGTDVHVMAASLSKTFEEKFGRVEADYFEGPEAALHERTNEERMDITADHQRIENGLYSERHRDDQTTPKESIADQGTRDMGKRAGRGAGLSAIIGDLKGVKKPEEEKAKAPRKRPPKAAKEPRPRPVHEAALPPRGAEDLGAGGGRAMPQAEKEALAEGLMNLMETAPERMNEVLQIVQRFVPQDEPGEGEIELDINKLDDKTLWELRDFIEGLKEKATPAPPPEDVAEAVGGGVVPPQQKKAKGGRKKRKGGGQKEGGDSSSESDSETDSDSESGSDTESEEEGGGEAAGGGKHGGGGGAPLQSQLSGAGAKKEQPSVSDGASKPTPEPHRGGGGVAEPQPGGGSEGSGGDGEREVRGGPKPEAAAPLPTGSSSPPPRQEALPAGSPPKTSTPPLAAKSAPPQEENVASFMRSGVGKPGGGAGKTGMQQWFEGHKAKREAQREEARRTLATVEQDADLVSEGAAVKELQALMGAGGGARGAGGGNGGGRRRGKRPGMPVTAVGVRWGC